MEDLDYLEKFGHWKTRPEWATKIAEELQKMNVGRLYDLLSAR